MYWAILCSLSASSLPHFLFTSNLNGKLLTQFVPFVSGIDLSKKCLDHVKCFSVLVLHTTIPIMKDVSSVLMHKVPPHIDVGRVRDYLLQREVRKLNAYKVN